jgi:dynein heavy chain
LKTFEKGLQSLQDISQLEQKLMPHLFKSTTKMFLKVPIKPDEMPDKPDLNNKKLLPDENEWVYEEFMRLRTRVFESVDPMAEYLKTYDQFASDYALKPQEVIASMDDPENPTEPDVLRRDVISRRARAQKLMDSIPELMTVSFFQIDCRSIRTTLSEKHLKIANEEIELIAKQAKVSANKISLEFDNKDLKIIAVPSNIEELSDIRTYMSQVPMEIEKLNLEIKKTTDIYDMLNEFQYSFAEEDDADKRWRVFGQP